MNAERPRQRACEVAVGRRLPGLPLCPLASKAHQVGAPKKSSVHPYEPLERAREAGWGGGRTFPPQGAFLLLHLEQLRPPKRFFPGLGWKGNGRPQRAQPKGQRSALDLVPRQAGSSCLFLMGFR